MFEEGKFVTINPSSKLKPLPRLNGQVSKGGRMASTEDKCVLFDNGYFTGALFTGDLHYVEGRPLVVEAHL